MFRLAIGRRDIARRGVGTADNLGKLMAGSLGVKGGGYRCVHPKIERLGELAHDLSTEGDGTATLKRLMGIGSEAAPDTFGQARAGA